MVNLCSVVTKNCLTEFLLTKFSCEKFNNCNWHVSCDQVSADYLSRYQNIKTYTFEVNDEISDHNSTLPAHRAQFLNIIMNKFAVLEKCLEVNSHAFFIDSDMLFVGPLDHQAVNLLDEKRIDFVVSPHYSRDPMNEDKHGFYNVGMFALHDSENLKQWKYLTENCEKLGLYYEQKPFELVLSNFSALNLPINHNVGWWRFNNPRTNKRIKQLKLENDRIFFGSLPVVNFHFHVFKEPGGYNPGSFLVKKVLEMLEDSNLPAYKEILQYYETLSKEAI